ncbi:MAG: hypothetical protein Fur006_57930 [Coleofasciculaceae cyanobacterium]
MARLYADEQFPRETVLALRTLGHDILTVQEAGKANQQIPDVREAFPKGASSCLRYK